MNGLDQFYFEWMDWTSSRGDLWIPLWQLLSGQTWKLAQREGEEENLIFTEMCRIFFLLVINGTKKWVIKVNLMFDTFFVFERGTPLFLDLLSCDEYITNEKKKEKTNYDIGSTCQLRERGVCLWHRIINKWVAHTSSSPRGENGN